MINANLQSFKDLVKKCASKEDSQACDMFRTTIGVDCADDEIGPALKADDIGFVVDAVAEHQPIVNGESLYTPKGVIGVDEFLAILDALMLSEADAEEKAVIETGLTFSDEDWQAMRVAVWRHLGPVATAVAHAVWQADEE